MKLTQSIASKLALPPGKSDAIFFDDDVHGLGLRLRAGGKRSWIFQYGIGSKTRRMTLGMAPALSLAAARKTAAELHARVHLGEDPAASKREGQRRAADTVEAVLRLYLPEKRQTLALNTCRALEHHLLRYAKPLHGLGVALVSRRDIGNLLATVAASSGQPSANATRASLSAFFSWCMGRGLVEQNPVIGTHAARLQPRTRVLSLAELAAVWRASGEDAYGAIVKLLILTGQRREEIGGLRFGEIGDGIVALPAGRAKNRRTHVIPLSAPAQAILAAQPPRSEFVFGTQAFVSWSWSKRLLDSALAAAGSKLTPWTLHDLRRSVATGMAELGVAPHIVEAVLNHISGSNLYPKAKSFAAAQSGASISTNLVL
jgi:integrase